MAGLDAGFNFDTLELGAQRGSSPRWVAVAPPLVIREKVSARRRQITRAERRAGASSDDDEGSSSSSSHNDVDIPVLPAARAGTGSRHGRRKHAEKTLPPAAETAAQLQERSASAPPAQTLPPALLGAPKKISSRMLLAREEADVKRGPEGSAVEWLEPESDVGNVEYKLRLKDNSTVRFQQLVTQMKFRLSEGNGECLYYLGVEDDGYPRGLSEADLETSLAALTAMAAEVHAAAQLERSFQGSAGRRCVLARVRRICRDEVTYAELRIAVAGGVETGKSTLIAVLTHGANGRPALDNGRGSARMAVVRHKHEIESGRTSSLSAHIVGYDAAGGVLNYSGVAALTPAEIATHARKVLRFIDLGGDERYLKTALYGMTAMLPSYALLCISARAPNLPRAAREHIAVALALGIPLAAVLTQVDVATPGVVESVVSQLRSVLAAAVEGAGTASGLNKQRVGDADVVLPLVASESQAAALAHGMAANRVDMAGAAEASAGPQPGLTVPLFVTSSLTGSGIPLLHAFLAALQPSAPAAHTALQAPWKGACDEGQAPPGSDASSVFALSFEGEDGVRTSADGSSLHPGAEGAAPLAGDSRPATPAAADEGSTHFQVDQTFEVRGVGSVVSGTVVSGAVALGQHLLLGPDEAGAFRDVTVTCIHREQLPVRVVRSGQHATLAVHPRPASSLPKPHGSGHAAPASAPIDVALAGRQERSEANGAKVAAGKKGEDQLMSKEVPDSSEQQHEQQRPTEAGDVFRIPHPCSSSTAHEQELARGPLLQRVHQERHPDTESHINSSLTAEHAPSAPITQLHEPAGSSNAAAGELPIPATAGGIAQGLAKARASHGVHMGGPHAAAVGDEGFGVGTTALEAADPTEFGGLQISWAAERNRWAVHAASAPSLVSVSAPNARKGTVLLSAGGGEPPAGVWRFEALMVLLSGHWPPRGLLSGHWPPQPQQQRQLRESCSVTADAQGWGSGSDSCSGSSWEAAKSRRGSWPGGGRRSGSVYTPVVHCGSVRQAATVVHIAELLPTTSSAAAGPSNGGGLPAAAGKATEESAASVPPCLTPAVAAAAALLCSAGGGGSSPQTLQRYSSPLGRGARTPQGASPLRGGSPLGQRPLRTDPSASPAAVLLQQRTDSPTSSEDGGTCLGSSLPAASFWPGRIRGSSPKLEDNTENEEPSWAAAPGCCARVTLEFCQRPEWLRPGAALIVRDRGDNCVSGAGVVRRLLPRSPRK